MDLTPPIAAGVVPTGGGALVDLNSLPVIRQTIPHSERLVPQHLAEAYQKGELPLDAITPLASPAATAQVPPTSASVPAANPATVPAAALPVNAPLAEGDTRRVKDRINDLFGKWKTAEERATDAETRLGELLSRLEARVPQPPVPYTNQYNSYAGGYPAPQPPSFEAPQEQQPPAGQYVSRAEMMHFLRVQAQETAAQAALSNAHTVSRLEAERRFPDVFSNPELRAAADEVWSRSPLLQRDPRGPELATAIARGLYYDPTGPAPVPQLPAAVRKEGLSAIGASVPEGSPASNDRVQRYEAALEYARRTGRIEDMVRARQISLGQL